MLILFFYMIKDCNLVQVGPSIQRLDASWSYNVDFSSNCTSYVETVISTILLNMGLNGVLDSLYYQGKHE